MVSTIENTIDDLIDNELYDDGSVCPSDWDVALILAEESNLLHRDSKWLLYIGKALYHKGLDYRCILCLGGCNSAEST